MLVESGIATPSLVIGHPDPLARHGLAALLRAGGFPLKALADDAADFARRTRGHRPDAAAAPGSFLERSADRRVG